MDSGSLMKSLHFITPLAQMDLAEWMVRPKPPAWLQGLERSETRRFLYRSIYALVSGLSFLHREKEGTITAHHDLKPKNILVFGGDLMIADFGSSHLRPLAEGSETQRNHLGTYEYHPPEYWKDDGSQARLKHGRAFDIWSMGCIIIKFVTLIVHGWESEKLSDFRNQRRQNPHKTRPKVTGRDGDDCSFHNNWVVVKKWILELQVHDGSQKLKSTLSVALQMMDHTRESRLYAWEAELDLYNIQQHDDPLIKMLENGSLCVQSPQKHIPNSTQTPLHRAAHKGDKTRICELLDAKWPLNIRDHNDLTAWEVLEQNQDPDYYNTLRPRLAPTTSEKPANEEQGQKFDQEQAIKAQVTEDDKELATFVGRQEGSHSEGFDQEFRQITTWLSPLNFWARQQDIINNRTKDTGTWLLERTEYQSWKHSSGDILWCHGIPSAGKTVLASVIVEDLEHRASAFLYCNYKERAQQTFQNLISSLTRQLIHHSRTIPSELRRLYQRSLDIQIRPTRQELLRVLTIVGSKFSSLYIVIDALDECDDTEEIRSSLVSTLCGALPRANLLVTSRHVPDIEMQFENRPRLQIKATEEDIRRYVSDQILRKPNLKKHVKADPDLRELMIETIGRKSDGMFLLVTLHIASLASKTTRNALRRALESLPTELDDTYDEALQRVRDQNEESASLAEDVLMWVVFAVVPLSVVQLQHAIASISLESKSDIGDEELTDPETLLDVCAGIIVIDTESNVVRFVHYTTQEYFDRHPLRPLPVAQGRMTKACINYLSLAPSDWGDEDYSNHDVMHDWYRQHPFVYYAGLHWGKHARGLPENDCRSQILKLIYKESIRAITAYVSDYLTPLFSDKLGRLAYAAAFGLTSIVNHLLDEGVDVNQTYYNPIPALMTAAGAGYVDTFRLLLADGADVNRASNIDNSTALVKAASNGHDNIVRILLDHEANLEAETFSRETSLLLAAKGGFTSTVQLLVEKGANVSAGRGLLHAAITSGNTAMVELAANKIGELTKGEQMENILVQLLKLDVPSIAIFELLIARGADPTGSKYGETPIGVAARTENVEAIRSLLEHGVSPNIRDEDGYTPIHRAALNEDHEMIKILVDHGTDLTAQDDAGDSGLHTALHSGFDDNSVPHLVSLLVRGGFPVNTPDAEGKTALHIAAHRGLESTVEFLMEHGADCNRKDHGCRTPLETAAISGNEKVVEQMLKHLAIPCPPRLARLLAGARLRNAVKENDTVIIQEILKEPDLDVTIPEVFGRTALHFAAYYGQKTIVESLLKRGALVNGRRAGPAKKEPNTRRYICEVTHQHVRTTPLHLAAQQGHTAVVELLLKHDADLDATDVYGYKAFFIAVQTGHAGVVGVLLEHGSQVSESPNGWGTPLSTSLSSTHEDVVRLLLENGADAERDTDWGKKALDRAMDYGKHEIAELLRKHGFTTSEEWEDISESSSIDP